MDGDALGFVYLDTILLECLTGASPNSNSAVAFEEAEAALIGEDDSFPLLDTPVSSLHGPSLPSCYVGRAKLQPLPHPPASQTGLPKTRSDRVRAENVAHGALLIPHQPEESGRKSAVGSC